MVVSVDVLAESWLSAGVMTTVDMHTVYKDNMRFGLLLCWEPLFISITSTS